MTYPPGHGEVPEDDSLIVRSRNVLLQALHALHEHRDSVIVVGAQAIYLHTGAAATPVAESTKDSDLAIDVRCLADQPLIDAAMRSADFELDPMKRQPGAWASRSGIPVDLLVPETLAGGSGSRTANHPPHHKRSLRRAAGLEAALIDHELMKIGPLKGDGESVLANVAGPAALLVAKLHKIGERADAAPDRLIDKDAHDIYRLLVAIETLPLAGRLAVLRSNDLAAEATEQALMWLRQLFGAGPDALGSLMAARTEEPYGTAETVAAASAALAQDLLTALGI